jgi:hypothetical protein
MSFVRGVYPADRVVASATWLYGGTAICDVRIVFSPICFGSGDEDDPPEMMHDVQRDTFYVEYGSTVERGVFNNGGGGFKSLREAMRHVESMLQDVQWLR